MANWTNEQQPFGVNHAPLLAGTSVNDGKTGVPVAVDPTTGRILGNTIVSGTGLLPTSYDYVAYTNTSSLIDTYVYKTGGSGGTTVATVTITYTDITKVQLSTVART
jgi:hypothetical protein